MAEDLTPEQRARLAAESAARAAAAAAAAEAYSKQDPGYHSVTIIEGGASPSNPRSQQPLSSVEVEAELPDRPLSPKKSTVKAESNRLGNCLGGCRKIGKSGEGDDSKKAKLFWQRFTKLLPPGYQEAAIIFLTVGAGSSLLAALVDEEPHLMAAALAALLACLSVYAYMLKAECRRLSAWLDVGVLQTLQTQSGASEKSSAALQAAAEFVAGDKDFDVSTGAAGAFGYMQPSASMAATSAGKTGGVVQSVLTASLVNEYLRLAACLRGYRERHGPLPAGSPGSEAMGLGMAEALLAAGLGGYAGATAAPVATAEVNNSMRSVRSVQSAASRKSNEGVETADFSAEGAASSEAADASTAEPSPTSAETADQSPPEGGGIVGLFGVAPMNYSSIEDSMRSLPPWLQQIRG
eukprot:TRINITY_DN17776_c1_g3_i1.p1 TRINITY_DN17776_c1_g3~~TRINITY_DN17776_c1_g3_i1.p1  ORF type:complete len:409 (+),score=118.66 TRINITY_DN17776_c1_g3_i1:52-1278(+)